MYDRLGDAAINDANATKRHDTGLKAIFTAIKAGSSERVILGDRGDGSPAAKAEAKRRYAHINSTTIPDAIRFSTPPTCYEHKDFTPFLLHPALGHGSQRNGGAPSRADGYLYAFGSTEEHARKKAYGLKQRGAPTDRPFNRSTGFGYVAACNGSYSDAIAKRNPAVLVGTESTGALMPGLIFLLHVLAKNIKRGIAQDTTVYGTARVSPKAFFAHHVAEIAAAVVFADALTIRNAASHQSRCAVLGDFLVAESVSRHGQPSSVGSSANAPAV